MYIKKNAFCTCMTAESDDAGWREYNDGKRILLAGENDVKKEFSQAKKWSLVCAKIAKNFFPLVTSLSSHLNSIETLQSKPDNTNINFHRLLQILSYAFVLLSVLRATSVSESLQQKHLSCVLWKSAAGLSGKTFLSAIYCSQFWWYLWN